MNVEKSKLYIEYENKVCDEKIWSSACQLYDGSLKDAIMSSSRYSFIA